MEQQKKWEVVYSVFVFDSVLNCVDEPHVSAYFSQLADLSE
jgi:hypothetical protein